MAFPQSLSVEQVRQILSEVIEALESPDYAPKLDEAKEAAGNEMLKMMQIVFPIVAQIEMETIKHHGFSNTREGGSSSSNLSYQVLYNEALVRLSYLSL